MKELYISPEIKLLGFMSAEDLVYNSGAELDDLLGSNNSGGVSGVTPDIGDVDVDIGL